MLEEIKNKLLSLSDVCASTLLGKGYLKELLQSIDSLKDVESWGSFQQVANHKNIIRNQYNNFYNYMRLVANINQDLDAITILLQNFLAREQVGSAAIATSSSFSRIATAMQTITNNEEEFLKQITAQISALGDLTEISARTEPLRLNLLNLIKQMPSGKLSNGLELKQAFGQLKDSITLAANIAKIKMPGQKSLAEDAQDKLKDIEKTLSSKQTTALITPTVFTSISPALASSSSPADVEPSTDPVLLEPQTAAQESEIALVQAIELSLIEAFGSLEVINLDHFREMTNQERIVFLLNRLTSDEPLNNNTQAILAVVFPARNPENISPTYFWNFIKLVYELKSSASLNKDAVVRIEYLRKGLRLQFNTHLEQQHLPADMKREMQQNKTLLVNACSCVLANLRGLKSKYAKQIEELASGSTKPVLMNFIFQQMKKLYALELKADQFITERDQTTAADGLMSLQSDAGSSYSSSARKNVAEEVKTFLEALKSGAYTVEEFNKINLVGVEPSFVLQISLTIKALLLPAPWFSLQDVKVKAEQITAAYVRALKDRANASEQPISIEIPQALDNISKALIETAGAYHSESNKSEEESLIAIKTDLQAIALDIERFIQSDKNFSLQENLSSVATNSMIGKKRARPEELEKSAHSKQAAKIAKSAEDYVPPYFNQAVKVVKLIGESVAHKSTLPLNIHGECENIKSFLNKFIHKKSKGLAQELKEKGMEVFKLCRSAIRYINISNFSEAENEHKKLTNLLVEFEAAYKKYKPSVSTPNLWSGSSSSASSSSVSSSSEEESSKLKLASPSFGMDRLG